MTIKLTIDRFENDQVVLRAEDGVVINWPRKKLPDNVHEGTVLVCTVLTDGQTEKEKRDLAKEILNEILTVEK